MSNRIIVDQATSNGAKILARGVNHIKEGIADLKRSKEIMDAAQYDNDNAGLAAEFGVQGADQPTKNANAAAMIGITAASITALEHDAIDELRRLDQG